MFKIGNFSKLSKISIRMLRHYNDIGLLEPIYVDSLTGYRYYNAEQLSIANKIQALKEMGFSLSVIDNPCYSLAVFHDEGYKETDVDVEIQMSVVGSYKDTENVQFKTVELITMASVIVKGGYEQMPNANEALANWVLDNKYEFNHGMFTIYHVSAGQDSNPENWVTEVCCPVCKK